MRLLILTMDKCSAARQPIKGQDNKCPFEIISAITNWDPVSKSLSRLNKFIEGDNTQRNPTVTRTEFFPTLHYQSPFREREIQKGKAVPHSLSLPNLFRPLKRSDSGGLQQ